MPSNRPASRPDASAVVPILLFVAVAAADDCNLNGIPDDLDVQPTFHFGPVEFDTDFSPEDLAASAVTGVNTRIPFNADDDDNADAVFIGGDLPRSALLLHGDGQGGFTPEPLAIDISPDASYSAIAAGTFAGDSAHDLALGYWDTKLNKYFAVILVSDGGIFTPGTSVEINGYPLGMTAADFSGDGLPDLAFTLTGNKPVATLKNLGNGNLGPPQYSTYTGAAGGIPSAADIDGDTDIDLAVSATFTDKAVILYNNGQGKLDDFDEYLTGSTNTHGVALFDLDGDDVPDLATANRGANLVSVLVNQGDGQLNPAKTYAICFCPSPESYRIEAADFDGDGDGDLAVGCLSFPDGRAILMTNNGDGTFREGVSFAAPNHTYGLDAGDLNNDGLPDLALACLDIEGGDDSNAVIMINASEPFSPDCNANGIPDECDLRPLFSFAAPKNFAVTDQPVNLIARKVLANNTEVPLDFNADGFPDIVTAEEGGYVSVLINKGKVQNQWAGFNPSVPYVGGTGPIAVAAGNLDADGDADVVASDVQGGKLAVLFNEGNGVLGDAVLYEDLSNSGNIAGVALADVNGDGSLDVIATFGADAMAAVLFNDGTGKLTLDDVYDTEPGPRSVICANVDKKNGPDLVVSSEGMNDPAVCILLNKGDGTFNPSTSFEAGDEPYHTVVVDLDKDGNLDLAVANNAAQMDTSPSVSVLYGAGDGSFGPPTHYPIAAKRIDAGDFDKDGFPDLATGAVKGVTLLRNTPDGFDGAGYYQTGVNTSGTVAADFDKDGDLDLAIANQKDNTISVLLFQATSPPESGDANDDGVPDECACYADFDHSGSLDFFDFLAFVNAFNDADPDADCDHDAALNFFDFLCFVNAFNDGC